MVSAPDLAPDAHRPASRGFVDRVMQAMTDAVSAHFAKRDAEQDAFRQSVERRLAELEDQATRP